MTAVIAARLRHYRMVGQQVFESTRPAIYVSLFAALFIGFSLNALHGRVENSPQHGLLSRSATRRGGPAPRLARAGQYVVRRRRWSSFSFTNRSRVLGLTEDALFLAQREDGAFVRAADRGWTRRRSRAYRSRGSAHRRAARRASSDRARRPAARGDDFALRRKGALARRAAADARRGLRLRVLRGTQRRHALYGRRARAARRQSPAAPRPRTITSMPSNRTLESPSSRAAYAHSAQARNLGP